MLTIEGYGYRFWYEAVFGATTDFAGNFRLEEIGETRGITFDEEFLNDDNAPGRHEVFRGIYKVEGDRLTLCICQDRRPTEFAAPQGSPNSLKVYERSTSDRFKLMGTWDLVEGDPLKLIGPEPREAIAKPATLIFRGDWFVFPTTLPPEECAGDDSGVFTLDERRTPRTIDLQFVLGRSTKMTLLGLYELDAKGRTLKLCLGKQRPATFENGPNSTLCVYRFKSRF